MSSARDKQVAEAEEMLGDSLDKAGFAKGLYFGRYLDDRLLPYPKLTPDPPVDELVERLRQFCRNEIDPVAIDREARIPDSVVQGLGRLGILGACLPKSCGGLELTQTQYCRLLEVLGGHCASTALFVNAHHSIGPRALVLFGTAQQQERWLPKLASGEWISAFALTEPEAGSDAANVQTQAVPTPDGSGYVLNGQKRWITNGGIAQALTVMARTPIPGQKDTKITAFLVTPDMPGFEVLEARMPKCGVRGSATARLAFHDMFVPRENVLGKLGKGLKIALTVLDFGRTTFGASCTGAAKFCLAKAVEHANARVQFGQTLGSFELVKEKIAYMAAGTFAMESATYQTAALIDSGSEDYMVETAMLKVFATDVLWKIINDTIQIFGGKAYFTDEPYERMMRDARINMIGEGANDVLRAFMALVGMRDVGLELQGVLNAVMNPVGNLGRIGRFASRKVGSLLASPNVKVRSTALQDDAQALGRLVGTFGSNVEALLRKHREEVLDRQYQQGRVADAAAELYVSASVLNRLDALMHDEGVSESERQSQLATGRYYLLTAGRRIRANLAALWDNDDEATTQLANEVLRSR
ncbi:MAG TPA: acyl-CoA dehydrogenase family protein [Pirellulales bacterium]|jgi:alkylation response protein AidB-like acyl-CoA dehydrogenase|nr:acyl-CoA dehydrogenase family protein [Pirellulales bacterium]